MADEGHQGFGFGRSSILLGFLSLQLMLLAFFIVLVSMSTFDDRRIRSVLGSIQDVFADLPNAVDGADAQSNADAIALDAIRDEVADVFATALQLDRIERTGAGAVELEVAADRLFARGTAQLLPGTEAILRRVVAALDARPAGYRYELDVLVGRTMSMSDGQAGAPDTAIEVGRAGMLVRAFVTAGALPSGMAAGLQPQAQERVRLVLRLVPGARPHDRFLGVPGKAVRP